MDALQNFNNTISGFDNAVDGIGAHMSGRMDDTLADGRAWLQEKASLATGLKQEHKEALTDIGIAAATLPAGIGKVRKYFNRTRAGAKAAAEEDSAPNAMSESGAPSTLSPRSGRESDAPGEDSGGGAGPRTTSSTESSSASAESSSASAEGSSASASAVRDPVQETLDSQWDRSGTVPTLRPVPEGGAPASASRTAASDVSDAPAELRTFQPSGYGASQNAPDAALEQPELFPEYAQVGQEQGLFGRGPSASTVDLDVDAPASNALRIGEGGIVRRRGLPRMFRDSTERLAPQGNQEPRLQDYEAGEGVTAEDTGSSVLMPDFMRAADPKFYHGSRLTATEPAAAPPPAEPEAAAAAEPEAAAAAAEPEVAEAAAAAASSGGPTIAALPSAAEASDAVSSALTGAASKVVAKLPGAASSALQKLGGGPSPELEAGMEASSGLQTGEAGALGLSEGLGGGLTSEAALGGTEALAAAGAEAGSALMAGATAFGPLGLAVGGIAMGLMDLLHHSDSAPAPQAPTAISTAADAHGLTFATKTGVSDGPAGASAF